MLDSCVVSYWPGCLRLLKKTDQWQKALQLEVKLDDLSLLNGKAQYGKNGKPELDSVPIFELNTMQKQLSSFSSSTSSFSVCECECVCVCVGVCVCVCECVCGCKCVHYFFFCV